MRRTLTVLFLLLVMAVQAHARTYTLTWHDNSINELGFVIYAIGPWIASPVEIGRVGADVTTFTTGEVTTSGATQWFVRAYNEGGESTSSNVVNNFDEKATLQCVTK